MSETAQLPIDMIIFCPSCHTQHIDAADPLTCQDCGHGKTAHHFWKDVKEPNLCVKCECQKFNPWLNPPHKSHRCDSCNLVFRIADVSTNGVANIQTKGSNDSWSIHIQSEG